jgi:hypothetical protein
VHGIAFPGGVSAHPRLTIVPLTASPCAGALIVPNGLVAAALLNVTVRRPSSTR